MIGEYSEEKQTKRGAKLMSKRTNRALLAGLAGAVGVVTSTQLPNVQAAMKELSQQDASASSSQTIGSDPIHQAIKQDLKRQAKNGRHQITTKSTIVRERAEAQKKVKASQGPVKASSTEPVMEARAKVTSEPDAAVMNLAAAQPSEQPVEQNKANAEPDTVASTVSQPASTSEQVAEPAQQQTSQTSTPAEQAAYDDVVTDKSQATDTIQYTISDGDTLSSIAAAHGVTTADIYAANAGDLGLLQIGQVISIPKASTHAEGTVTDASTKTDATSEDQNGTTVKTESEPSTDQVDNQVAPSEDSNQAKTSQEQVDSQKDVKATPAQSETSSEQGNTTQDTGDDKQAAPAKTTSTNAQPTQTATKQQVAQPVATNLQVTSQPTQTNAPQPVAHTTSQEQTSTTTDTQATAPQATVTVKTGSLSASQRSTIVNEAVNLAHQNIPYVWGGKTTSGFDCSGLVAYVYGQAGASLPAYTVAQEGYVSSQDVSSVADVTAKAQPGDILFWGGHGSTWHSAIYIGGGQFVAAPQPGSNVSVQTLSASFLPDFVGTLN